MIYPNHIDKLHFCKPRYRSTLRNTIILEYLCLIFNMNGLPQEGKDKENSFIIS